MLEMKLNLHKIEKVPPLYSQENSDDPICYVKFFDPCSNWTWYGMEYDPNDKLFFGYVIGFEKELGYFSLDELMGVKNKLGLPLEMDLHFDPTPLSKVKELET